MTREPDYDVVIGDGGAGLAAAVSAAGTRLSVLAIEAADGPAINQPGQHLVLTGCDAATSWSTSSSA